MLCIDCIWAVRQRGDDETEELTVCGNDDISNAADRVPEEHHLYSISDPGVYRGIRTPSRAEQEDYLMRTMGVDFPCPFGGDPDDDRQEARA